MAKPEEEQHDEDFRPVKLPSGGIFNVYKTEVSYFNDRVKKYLSDNIFQNISDLQDIDRLLIEEVLCWRWGNWIFQGRDYWGDTIDEKGTAVALKDHSSEIRQIKKSLGLDKESRDKQRGEDSVENYIINLRQRAQEFGIVRNDQAAKSIELFQELKAMMTLHDNCDTLERIEEEITVEHLMQWIRTKAIPEFDEIDAKFRETSQKMWIRKQ